MSKKDLDLLYIYPTTPKNLRITICLSIYMCEILSIVAQTCLYIDIDFLKISEEFKMHIRYEVTLLFGVSMVGSLLNIMATPISCASVSNLQQMVDFQQSKKKEHELRIREQNDVQDRKLQQNMDEEQRQKLVQEEYDKMEQQYEAAKEERYR